MINIKNMHWIDFKISVIEIILFEIKIEKGIAMYFFQFIKNS